MRENSLQIQVVDPQGKDALAHNPPSSPRGICLLVYGGTRPVGSGALRPIDESTVEIRRMYVLKKYRRHGMARMILEALEREAADFGYVSLRLETRNRQTAAMRLYSSYGFTQIPPSGSYANDPISVCYEKFVQLK